MYFLAYTRPRWFQAYISFRYVFFIVFMGFSQFWEVRGATIALRGPYSPCIAFYVIVR
nr:MAG TPA: hypothetical protein [Bacteriophage sp.]